MMLVAGKFKKYKLPADVKSKTILSANALRIKEVIPVASSGGDS
jgi:hypothetical protein